MKNIYFYSKSGEVWNPSEDPLEPWSLDPRDWSGDGRVQAETQRAHGVLSDGHWANVRQKRQVTLSAPLCYHELGSNRKYLNCLSQHLRSTHKTTIPHFQLQLFFLMTTGKFSKILRQQTCVCLLFSSFLCYLVSLWIFPGLFGKPWFWSLKFLNIYISCIMFYLYLWNLDVYREDLAI